jgi:hypothetical protein
LPKTIDKNYYVEAENNDAKLNDCPNNPLATRTFEKGAQNKYRYSAQSGSYCDHFSFPNRPHSTAYLVFVKSQNIKGLPLNFCITNYTSRRCDIYSKLTKFTNTGQDIFFLPQSDSLGTGYDINIENEGINGSPSVNDFYSATFIPIPFSLLSQIQSGTEKPKIFPGVISSNAFYNPQLMTATIKNSPALLNLSYAYNPDFHAYKVGCQKGLLCSLSLLFTPIWGQELEHVKSLSWENSWIIKSPGNVVIIFIPQYLEYFGVLAFAVFMAVLLFYPLTVKLFGDKLDNYFEDKSDKLKRKVKNILDSN